MQAIKDFLEKYTSELEFYQKASRLCAQICEKELERAGIRAIVTYRAKKPEKLKEKIIKRNSLTQYTSVSEIYDDIVDLAGVRIALYFPGDQGEIDKFIHSNFTVVDTKIFPQMSDKTLLPARYTKLFSGYRATHYRVNLKKERCSESHKKFCNMMIEIQVASVLMHAWAEVEHDLIYKPMSGTVSTDEYEILDELNGLVLSGEIALNRLQKAFKDRVSKRNEPFANHYELAAFLYNQLVNSDRFKTENFILGRSDRLYNFLGIVNLNTPVKLEPFLKSVKPDESQLTAVQKIVEAILIEEPDYHSIFLDVKLETLFYNPYTNSTELNPISTDLTSVYDFVYKMVELEKKYKIVSTDYNQFKLIVENQEILNCIDYIRNLRDKLLNANTLPEQIDIDYGKSAINKLIHYFS